MSILKVISSWKYQLQHFGWLHLMIHKMWTVVRRSQPTKIIMLKPSIASDLLQTKYQLGCSNIWKKYSREIPWFSMRVPWISKHTDSGLIRWCVSSGILYPGTAKQLHTNIKKRFSFFSFLLAALCAKRNRGSIWRNEKSVRTAPKSSKFIQRRSCWEGLGTKKWHDYWSNDRVATSVLRFGWGLPHYIKIKYFWTVIW